MRNTLTGTVAAIVLAVATAVWSPRPQPAIGPEALAASNLSDIVASVGMGASGCYLTVAGEPLEPAIVARHNAKDAVLECSDETLEAAAMLLLASCWDEGGEGWMLIQCDEDGIDIVDGGCGPPPDLVVVTPPNA